MSKSKRSHGQKIDSKDSKKRKGIGRAPPLPEDIPEDEIEVSEEDIDFVKEHSSYASFFNQNLDKRKLDKAVMGEEDPQTKPKKSKNEITDPEQYYEDNLKRISEENGRSEKMGFFVDSVDALPIKTLDGELVYRKSMVDDSAEKEPLTPEPQQQDPSERKEKVMSRKEKKNLSKSGKSQSSNTPLSELDAAADEISEEERMEILKLKMAEIGSSILADPETNLKLMEELLVLCKDEAAEIASLALLSACSVFKDIIPGYRIRPPSQKELEMSVSKEVKKLREFESSLLKHYEAYITHLIRLSKVSKFSMVAVRSLCALFSSVSHFNFREKILEFLIPRMASMDDLISSICCNTMSGVIKREVHEDGKVTLECVQLIADLIKKRKCLVRPEVIEVFLNLKFDENLQRISGSAPIKIKKSFKRVKRNAMGNSESNSSTLQSKREWKREKKKLTAQVKQQVKSDFRLSEASIAAEDRKKSQTLILSAVFETYFRVLKTSLAIPIISDESVSVTNRFGTRPLLSSSLYGLSKYSHLISVEFMSDLLTVLRTLASMAVSKSALQIESNPSKSSPSPLSLHGEGEDDPLLEMNLNQRLRCCIVAFQILKNNLDSLNVDLREFYVRLYVTLYEIPLDEKCGPYLSEALQVMLWDLRQLDVHRAAAFIKRMSTVSTHTNSASSIVVMSLIKRLLDRNSKCRIMLDNENGNNASISTPNYDPESTDPDLSGSLTSCLWELNLLTQHYHPHVSKMAKEISKMELSSTSASLIATTSERKPPAVFFTYDTSAGGFFPSPQMRSANQSKQSKFKIFDNNKLQSDEFISILNDSKNVIAVEMVERMEREAKKQNVDLTEEKDGEDDGEVKEEEEELIDLFSSRFKQANAFMENERLRNEMNRTMVMLKKMREHVEEMEEKQIMEKENEMEQLKIQKPIKDPIVKSVMKKEKAKVGVKGASNVSLVMKKEKRRMKAKSS